MVVGVVYKRVSEHTVCILYCKLESCSTVLLFHCCRWRSKIVNMYSGVCIVVLLSVVVVLSYCCLFLF